MKIDINKRLEEISENYNIKGYVKDTSGEYIFNVICKKCKTEYKKTFSKLKTCTNCTKLNKKYEKYSATIKEKWNDAYPIVSFDNDIFELRCNKHGNFKVNIYDIKKHNGCNKCRLESNKNKEYESWKSKAIEIHNDKFDYSLIQYNGSQSKIKIFCKLHGEFETTPESHIISKGGGCKQCRYMYCSESSSLGYNEIVKRANEKHKHKYKYVKNNNVRSLYDHINIICSKHGEFTQLVDNHLMGAGCPKCNKKTQSEIYEFIRSNYDNDILFDDRLTIKPLELDILLPDLKFAIEYNGLMDHSCGINEYKRFNNMKDLNIIKYKHRIKTEKCENKDINLFHIFEHEWIHKRNIVESMIKNKLRQSNKIYARKCQIKEINSNVCNSFLNSNHLLGIKNSKINIALFYENEIVAVMTFNTNEKYDYELTRFCNKLNTNVIGGASKLLKYFEKTYKPTSIITYTNRRFGSGGVYEKIGFEFNKSNIEPFAMFFKPNSHKIYTQTMFRKNNIKRYYENCKYDIKYYNEDESAVINMIKNGYRVIFDSGNNVYNKTNIK